MMSDRIPKKARVEPCLTLVPSPPREVEEKDLVQFTLKVRAGSAASAPVYKRKVARFANGTPAEWIEVLESLEELFNQNSLRAPEDQENAIKTILRGDSLTAFESSIQESREDPENPGQVMELTLEIVNKALQAVSSDVFPHRALAMQRLWMRRHMTKPPEMGIRKMASAVTQMNSKLIRFAGATEEDLFSTAELLEILEWTLPPSWRAKFDSNGYVPTEHSKARLIAEGEMIERSEGIGSLNAIAPNAAAKPNTKGKAPGRKTFFCTHHGADKGHNTADCFTLKNRDKQKAKPGPRKQPFSQKQLTKQIHAICKGKKGNKVYNQVAAIAKREGKKAKRLASNKKSSKPKVKAPDTSSSDSDSDSAMSVQVIERVEKKVAKVAERPNKNVWRNVDPRKKCLHRHRLSSTILDEDEDALLEEIAYHQQSKGSEESMEHD